MRTSSLILALISVSSCTRAEALQPDSRNPAHCIAAFNYGAYWFKVGNRPDKVTNMLIRGAYEMEKVKAAGRSPAKALDEGKALTKTYASDQSTMDKLFMACGTAQDADSEFRRRIPNLKARIAAVLGIEAGN